MKYLKVFTEFARATKMLSDAEMGRLFRAMLQYAEDGSDAPLNGNERFFWEQAKINIDKQSETYNNKVQGAQKARALIHSDIRSNQKQSDRLTLISEQEYIKEKEKDKEKSIYSNPPIVPPRGRFDEFWEKYPKKIGKGAAEKAFLKVKPNKQTFEAMLRAIEAQKNCLQWQRDNGQFIPNPATWINQRRWEDEVSVQPDCATDNIFLQMLREQEAQYEQG